MTSVVKMLALLNFTVCRTSPRIVSASSNTVYSKTSAAILEAFFCKKTNFFCKFLSGGGKLARFLRAAAGKLLQRRQNLSADPCKVARPAGRDGEKHEQAHLPRAGRHAEGEHRQPHRQAEHGVEHRAEKGPARMAARHAQHIEQQPERRAEPQRQRHLPELGERMQAHPPNRRDQKPPPDAVSSV